jgi:hypothetical protein
VLIVFCWFEAQQREPESVLAGRFPVTASPVATGFCEDGNDLIGKVNRPRITKMFDSHLKRGFSAIFEPSANDRFSIGQRNQTAAPFHSHHLCRLGFVFGDAGDVTRGSVRVFRGQQHLMSCIAPTQTNARVLIGGPGLRSGLVLKINTNRLGNLLGRRLVGRSGCKHPRPAACERKETDAGPSVSDFGKSSPGRRCNE